MFKNLIKVNHDGIIITQNDKIVFFNQQMNRILNIPNVSTSSASKYHYNKLLNAPASESPHREMDDGIKQPNSRKKIDHSSSPLNGRSLNNLYNDNVKH